MKKMKKLAALFLALVMVLSCMAMTAAAYGSEEHTHDETCCAEAIQPRVPAMQCSNCMQEMDQAGSGHDENGHFIILQCKNPTCTRPETAKIYW